MHLKSITLKKFRIFESIEIQFPDSNVIVFIGKNGSGKSTIMDSIAMLLSLFSGTLSTKGPSYASDYKMTDSDINVSSEKADIELDISFYDLEKVGNALKISISKEKDSNGYSYSVSPEESLENLKHLVQNDEEIALPIMAYYRTSRSNFEINPKKRGKKVNNLRLLAYENAFYENISSFSDFQEWFIHEENIENQIKVQQNNLSFRLSSLEIIRKALMTFIGYFGDFEVSDLRVFRESLEPETLSIKTSEGFDAYLVLTYQNKMMIRLDRMSSGEKNILLLVTDIARRLFLANRTTNSLTGTGVVLIDEIELHLHPKWQRNIIEALQKTFPNIQFVFSTHSPQVLSKIRGENVILLGDNQFYSLGTDPIGRDSNGILEEILGVDKRPPKVESQIDAILSDLSQKSSNIDFTSISNKFEALKKDISSEDPILLRIENFIERKKMLV